MICTGIDIFSAKRSDGLSVSNSWLETVCLLVVGMASARTVNLTLSVARCRRRRRLTALPSFTAFLAACGSWGGLDCAPRDPDAWALWQLALCLDRTHWKIARKQIKLLVLAVATRRYRVPLIWTVLGKAGNSSTKERIALMKRYLDLFGAESIKSLLADRELIVFDWLDFLHDQDIPFIIRVRSNQYVICEDGTRRSLRELLRTCRGKRAFTAHFGTSKDAAPVCLNFAAKRIKGKELLSVVSNRPAHHALTTYRTRWAIECMFAEAKTKGFNLEDTRLSIAKKLSLLVL